MRVTVLLGIVALVFVLSTASAQTATLSCRVAPNCGGSEVELFALSSATNAHVELPAETAYDSAGQKICCSGDIALSASCGSDSTIVSVLSSATNAHIEFPQDAYPDPNRVCLTPAATTSETIECEIDPVGWTSGTCVYRLSAATNAHVETCAMTTPSYMGVHCRFTSSGPDPDPTTPGGRVRVETWRNGVDSSLFGLSDTIDVRVTFTNSPGSLSPLLVSGVEGRTLHFQPAITVMRVSFGPESGSPLVNELLTVSVNSTDPNPQLLDDLGEDIDLSTLTLSPGVYIVRIEFPQIGVSRSKYITIGDLERVQVPDLPVWLGLLVGVGVALFAFRR